MPITNEENDKYRQFASKVAQELRVFDIPHDQIIWHYTDGPGFLGILQSATIYATQVAALNDSRETKYATDLFRDAVRDLIKERQDDSGAAKFLSFLLEEMKDTPETPNHGTSKFFVASFSGDEDDLTQWDRYGRKNGYAIGFHARGFFREPTSQVFRVIYDRDKHMSAVTKIASATLDFYREGLTEERKKDPQAWAREFFTAWDEWIYKLAPLAKDPKWKAENEFRLVHELKVSEFPRVRFIQKDTMLARYLPLETTNWMKSRQPLLPVAKVLIGPGNHPAFTKVSARLLLEQMGYQNVPVEITNCSLVRV